MLIYVNLYLTNLFNLRLLRAVLLLISLNIFNTKTGNFDPGLNSEATDLKEVGLLNLTDQELELIKDYPEKSWVYLPEAVKKIINTDIPILDFDEAKVYIKTFIDNSNLSKEEEAILQDY